MKNYIEITLIDSKDISVHELWSKLYTQLHLAFVEQQDQYGKVSVGVSFPEYHYESKKGGYLGAKLRVLAPNEIILHQLNLAKWLAHLSDNVHYTGIREVPSTKTARHVQFRRQHIKGNQNKLARRRAKRHGISLEQAMNHYQNKTSTSDLPYIQLKSLTTQHFFRLYIEKCECDVLVQDGFGTYGLSCLSTIPEF